MNDRIEKYVNENIQKLDSYIAYVLDPNAKYIGRYERLAVERFLKLKQKYIYNEAALRRVLRFFWLMKINSNNRYVRFPLFDFQVFWLASIYGLEKPDGTRLVKKVYITHAKKGGKSSFSAGLAIYETVYDKELDAESYVLASSKEQASQCFKYIKAIVDNSPDLPYIDIPNKGLIARYTYKNTVNKIQVKSADVKRLQGINASFCFSDEYGAHRDNMLTDQAGTSMSNRRSPLLVIMTTAYHNKDLSPAYDLEQTAKNTLDNVIENDLFFCQIFTLDDPEKEWNPIDMNVYRKSNPSWFFNENLREQVTNGLKQAQLMPSSKSVFMTDSLNVWVSQEKEWIPDERIKEIMIVDKPIPTGGTIFLGIDASAVKDLTGIFAIFYDQALDEFRGKAWFLFPNNPENRIKAGSVDLSVWIDQGHIIQTPEEVIKHEDIFKVLQEINATYNIKSIGIDPFLLQTFENEIKKMFKTVEVNKVRQYYSFLSEPLKHVEKYIILKKFHLPQDPCLRWNFRNVLIKPDDRGNIMIKKKQGQSVDGCVAMNIAMQQFLFYEHGYDPNSEKLNQYLDWLKDYDKK